MPGLYTRNAQNQETFRLTDRIVRLFTTVSASGNGYVDLPNEMGGTPMFFLSSPNPSDNSNQQYIVADAWIDGRRINWSSQPPGTVITYGVY